MAVWVGSREMQALHTYPKEIASEIVSAYERMIQSNVGC